MDQDVGKEIFDRGLNISCQDVNFPGSYDMKWKWKPQRFGRIPNG